MLHRNRVFMSSRFGDNKPQTYWRHDLDLSESRDVIGHVTIPLAVCHFLLAVNLNRASICNRFPDIWLQHMLTNEHTNTPTN